MSQSTPIASIRPGPPPRGRQWQTLILAGVVWSLWPIPSPYVFLGAYLVGLFLANWILPRLSLAPPLPEKTSSPGASPAGAPLAGGTKVRRWCWLLLALIPVAHAARQIVVWDYRGSWAAWTEHLGDRLALEHTPSIMPRLLASSQPQRFLIQAPGAVDVSVRWRPQSPPQSAHSLGAGLFLLDYDPRSSPEVADLATGRISVDLIVDGREHARAMDFVRPLPHPRWFHSLPAHGIAATVSEETDDLVIVMRDGTNFSVPVDDGPVDCLLLDDGERAVVSHRYGSDLCAVDVERKTIVARKSVGTFQGRLALSPSGKKIAVALAGERQGLLLLSSTNLTTIDFIPLDHIPDWIQFGRDDLELIVTDRQAHRISCWRGEAAAAATDEPSASSANWRVVEPSLVLPRPIVTMGRVSEGKKFVLASTAATTGIQPITANHFVENAILFLDVEEWKIHDIERTDRRSVRQDGAGDTESGVSPMGIAPAGKGAGFLVAFAGSSEVAASSGAPGARLHFRSLMRHSLLAPHGIADLGDGVWCVSSPSNGAIGILNGDELLHFVQLGPSNDELKLSDPAALLRRRGEQGFYEASRAGLSCQSCHLHLGPDYSRHNIGQGDISDTLTVHGVAGTSPYLRDGSNASLRALHEVAESIYRGYRREVPWDRREAIAAFLRGLPAEVGPRQLSPPNLVRLRAGYAAFRRAECHLCHSPPAMTNLGAHPVRQLFPDLFDDADSAALSDNHPFVDTPSLRGASLHPPYLHDGRATTLRDVLGEFNRADRHGFVGRLSPEEREELLYFLGEL